MKKLLVMVACLCMLAGCKKEEPANADSKAAEVKTSKNYLVKADGGLKMRETPDANGKLIALIANGDKLEFIEETGEKTKIAGAEGKWTKVTWKDKTGYVFGGFITPENAAGDTTVPDNFATLSYTIKTDSNNKLNVSLKNNQFSAYTSMNAFVNADYVIKTKPGKNGAVIVLSNLKSDNNKKFPAAVTVTIEKKNGSYFFSASEDMLGMGKQGKVEYEAE